MINFLRLSGCLAGLLLLAGCANNAYLGDDGSDDHPNYQIAEIEGYLSAFSVMHTPEGAK
jgi:hypothetical protein